MDKPTINDIIKKIDLTIKNEKLVELGLNIFGDVIESYVNNKYCKEEIFKSLIEKNIINFKEFSSSVKSGDSTEIGMDDDDLFIGLWLIFSNHINKNVTLKLFNFYNKGSLEDDFFKTEKPNLHRLKQIMNIGLNDESKLIIIPVTLANHFSLLLIDKEKIYLIDYELYHCMNVRMINNAENMNIKLKEINSLLKQKYNIEEEFFFTLFENELSEEREKEFKDLLKGRYGYDEEILNLIEECLSLKKQIMSSNISYIPKNEAIGNISFFYNQNLCKQMIILNIFSIQGTQTCSYFVLAT